MPKMSKSAKELKKDVKKFENSLIALNRLTRKLSSRINSGREKNKLKPKKLRKILRGGFFSRPYRWIQNVSTLHEKIVNNILVISAKGPPGEDDSWKMRNTNRVNALKSCLQKNMSSMKTYVAEIIRSLPARTAGGLFIAYIDKAINDKLTSEEWDAFEDKVKEMVVHLTSLIAVARDLKKETDNFKF